MIFFLESLKLSFFHSTVVVDIGMSIPEIQQDIASVSNDLGLVGNAFNVRTQTGQTYSHLTLSKEQQEEKDRFLRLRKNPHLMMPFLRKFDTTQSSLSYRRKAVPKVLIVDDNLWHLAASKFVFEKYIQDVHVAPNGKRALELMEQHTFDMVIVDAEMPVMDGPTMAEIVRHVESQSRESFRSLVVAMVTKEQTSDMDLMDACFLSGMDRYIIKPLLTHVSLLVGLLVVGRGTVEAFRRTALEKQWVSRLPQVKAVLRGADRSEQDRWSKVAAVDDPQIKGEKRILAIQDDEKQRAAVEDVFARQREEEMSRLNNQAASMRDRITDLEHQLEIVTHEKSKMAENRNEATIIALEARVRELQRQLDGSHATNHKLGQTAHDLTIDIKNLLENGSANEKKVKAAERRSRRVHRVVEQTECRMMELEDHAASADWVNYYGQREIRNRWVPLPTSTLDISPSWFRTDLAELRRFTKEFVETAAGRDSDLRDYLVRKSFSCQTLDALRDEISSSFDAHLIESTAALRRLKSDSDALTASFLVKEVNFWKHVEYDDTTIGAQVKEIRESIERHKYVSNIADMTTQTEQTRTWSESPRQAGDATFITTEPLGPSHALDRQDFEKAMNEATGDVNTTRNQRQALIKATWEGIQTEKDRLLNKWADIARELAGEMQRLKDDIGDPHHELSLQRPIPLSASLSEDKVEEALYNISDNIHVLVGLALDKGRKYHHEAEVDEPNPPQRQQDVQQPAASSDVTESENNSASTSRRTRTTSISAVPQHRPAPKKKSTSMRQKSTSSTSFAEVASVAMKRSKTERKRPKPIEQSQPQAPVNTNDDLSSLPSRSQSPSKGPPHHVDRVRKSLSHFKRASIANPTKEIRKDVQVAKQVTMAVLESSVREDEQDPVVHVELPENESHTISDLARDYATTEENIRAKNPQLVLATDDDQLTDIGVHQVDIGVTSSLVKRVLDSREGTSSQPKVELPQVCAASSNPVKSSMSTPTPPSMTPNDIPIVAPNEGNESVPNAAQPPNAPGVAGALPNVSPSPPPFDTQPRYTPLPIDDANPEILSAKEIRSILEKQHERLASRETEHSRGSTGVGEIPMAAFSATPDLGSVLTSRKTSQDDQRQTSGTSQDSHQSTTPILDDVVPPVAARRPSVRAQSTSMTPIDVETKPTVEPSVSRPPPRDPAQDLLEPPILEFTSAKEGILTKCVAQALQQKSLTTVVQHTLLSSPSIGYVQSAEEVASLFEAEPSDVAVQGDRAMIRVNTLKLIRSLDRLRAQQHNKLEQGLVEAALAPPGHEANAAKNVIKLRAAVKRAEEATRALTAMVIELCSSQATTAAVATGRPVLPLSSTLAQPSVVGSAFSSSHNAALQYPSQRSSLSLEVRTNTQGSSIQGTPATLTPPPAAIATITQQTLYPRSPSPNPQVGEINERRLSSGAATPRESVQLSPSVASLQLHPAIEARPKRLSLDLATHPAKPVNAANSGKEQRVEDDYSRRIPAAYKLASPEQPDLKLPPITNATMMMAKRRKPPAKIKPLPTREEELSTFLQTKRIDDKSPRHSSTSPKAAGAQPKELAPGPSSARNPPAAVDSGDQSPAKQKALTARAPPRNTVNVDLSLREAFGGVPTPQPPPKPLSLLPVRKQEISNGITEKKSETSSTSLTPRPNHRVMKAPVRPLNPEALRTSPAVSPQRRPSDEPIDWNKRKEERKQEEEERRKKLQSQRYQQAVLSGEVANATSPEFQTLVANMKQSKFTKPPRSGAALHF